MRRRPRRAWATRWRRRSTRSRGLADAISHEVAAESDPASHADAQLIADQERRAHRAAIDETMGQLQDRYRLAIELRLVQELSREDCAQRLGVTIRSEEHTSEL